MKTSWVCVPAFILFARLVASAGLAQTEDPAKPSPAPPAATAPADPALTADAILARMQRTYAGCKSYRDTGEVNSVFINKQGQTSERKPFKTWFVRPKLFRFEFKHQVRSGALGPWYRYVVWANGKRVRSWWSATQLAPREFESIEFALAGPSGISSGSAVNIPTLLMTEMHWGSSLCRLSDAKLLGTEKIDDAECYKIDAGARFDIERRQTLWIDKQTFLIRRLFQCNELGGITSETTTDYKPEINVDVPKKEFQFQPPDSEPDDDEQDEQENEKTVNEKP